MMMKVGVLEAFSIRQCKSRHRAISAVILKTAAKRHAVIRPACLVHTNFLPTNQNSQAQKVQLHTAGNSPFRPSVSCRRRGVFTHEKKGIAFYSKLPPAPPAASPNGFLHIIGRLVTVLGGFVVVAVGIAKGSNYWHLYKVKSDLQKEEEYDRGSSSSSAAAEHDGAPPQGSAAAREQHRELRLLSLNMFLRPSGIADDYAADDFKDERLDGFITEYLNADDFDVVCLQECFSTLNSRKARLIREARKRGFKFHSEAPPPPFWSRRVADGGLLVLSRFPFKQNPVFHSYVVAGKGSDAFADKGALHVCVELPVTGPLNQSESDGPSGTTDSGRQKGYSAASDTTSVAPHSAPGHPEGVFNTNEAPRNSSTGTSSSDRQTAGAVHIFCTHLQASYEDEDLEAAKVQIKQLEELRSFIDSAVAADDQVILCGDFNVDRRCASSAREEDPNVVTPAQLPTLTVREGGIADTVDEFPRAPFSQSVSTVVHFLASMLQLDSSNNGHCTGTRGAFIDLLSLFHEGRHPATYVACVDRSDGTFRGSNLHVTLSSEDFKLQQLRAQGESLDAVFLRCGGADALNDHDDAVSVESNSKKGGVLLRPQSCEVVHLPLSNNAFRRVSDHSGIAASFSY